MRPVAIALLVVGAIGVVVGIVVLVADGSDDGGRSGGGPDSELRSLVSGATPASEPFPGLTAVDLAVGGRCLHLVVADQEPERVEGLRARSDLGPYDGMLFVFPSDGIVSFTMAGVPDPLEIVFYGRDGRVVDRLHMAPCAGTDATCPVYTPRAAFRYALETGDGVQYDGSLAVPR